MCIAFPAKIVKIEEDMAIVELEGTLKKVSLGLVDSQVSVGDYVISHAGFAIHRIDEKSAKESLALLDEILEYDG